MSIFKIFSSKKEKPEQPSVVITQARWKQIQELSKEALKDTASKFRRSEVFDMRMKRLVTEVLIKNQERLDHELTAIQIESLAKQIITKLKKHW